MRLFSEMSERELRSIKRAAKELAFQEGSTLVQEGATGVGLHVILDGGVKVVVGGRTRARLGPGDHFGEMSLIDGAPRSASVIATTPVRTLALAMWSFGNVLDEYPTLTKKLLVALSRRLREADAALTD